MWERSEKHLVLALLFGIAAQPMTGFFAGLGVVISVVHCAFSLYYTFKEGKENKEDLK